MKEMKYLALAAVAVFGMTACQDDTDPKISTPTEFRLNTPPTANQALELTEEGTFTFTASQPNYGLTLAPTYGIEVSMKEDFTPLRDGTYVNSSDSVVAIPGSVTIPLESQIHAQLVVKQSALADAINQMRGIGSSASYTDTIAPLYVRATAMIANQPSTFIASNVVTLAEVKSIPFFAAGSTAPTDVLYTPGNPNGWSFDACMMIPASGDNVYEGYLAVDGDFKFTQNPSWDNPGNYGAGKLEKADDGTWSGELVENGGNFSGIEAGLYYVVAKITNPGAAKDEVVGDVKLTPITSVALTGDFNGWTVETPTEMTPVDGFAVWKAENVDLGDGGWKFILNKSWEYNLGAQKDSMKKLVKDGNNLKGEGTKTVILDLTKLPYSARYE